MVFERVLESRGFPAGAGKPVLGSDSETDVNTAAPAWVTEGNIRRGNGYSTTIATIAQRSPAKVRRHTKGPPVDLACTDVVRRQSCHTPRSVEKSQVARATCHVGYACSYLATSWPQHSSTALSRVYAKMDTQTQHVFSLGRSNWCVLRSTMSLVTGTFKPGPVYELQQHMCWLCTEPSEIATASDESLKFGSLLQQTVSPWTM